jgi:taurine dioxygenase
MPLLKYGPRPWLRAERERLAALRFERIGVRPVGATVGAEVSGVDLANVDDATFEEIRRAFLEFKVVFFRDQDIRAEQQVAFARRFGELEEHPFLPAKEGQEKIVQFAKDEQVIGVENVWHNDVTWREKPAMAAILRAVEVPVTGGDTLFVDTSMAYAGLDDEIKQQIDSAVAVNDFSFSFGLGMDAEQLRAQQAKFPAQRHPVVLTHPETGRRHLFVNAIFTSHIEGLPKEASDALLDRLFREVDVPEYQCRFHWQKNSVAFWDNRAVQHYALSDYDPQIRVMERVAIVGVKPR